MIYKHLMGGPRCLVYKHSSCQAIVQLNLNHCNAAQPLLCQAASEWGINIAIILDPYRVPIGNGNCVKDGFKIKVIWTTSKCPIQEPTFYEGNGVL